MSTTHQDSAPRPDAAVSFATALHQTPTPYPPTATPTSTPVPTVTPIPGWAKITTVAVEGLLPATELWLPTKFVGGDMFYVDRERTQAPLRDLRWTLSLRVELLTLDEANASTPKGHASGMTVLFAADSTADYDSAAKLRLVKLPSSPSKPFVNSIDDTFIPVRFADGPQRDSNGRYPILRSQATGFVPSGISISKLLYWIDAGTSDWLVICTTKESDLQINLPLFERIVESFTVLPNY